ncbi:RNA-binding protein rsd1 [Elsinoe australis]|uniref:RNA-binding protein rsd1 n=1 Tax=Elsinoe australis TaxID=40998 RepID=A0A2P7YC03_9PEZI|nr:RNA-binding protein rsd1 [Elsinoe australis]
MYFGPTGMAVDPVILPAPASKHTHAASKRRSDPFSDRSSIQASYLSGSTTLPCLSELEPYKPLTPPLPPSSEEVIASIMNTSTSLPLLHKKMESYQLANFLKTTGPGPERSKKHQRTTSMPNFRLFKGKDKTGSQSTKPSVGELQRSRGLNELPTHEEELPPSVEVKISKSGTRYYQIIPVEPNEEDVEQGKVPRLSSEIIESRVSISFTEALQEWNTLVTTDRKDEGQHRDRTASGQTVRIITDADEVPVRPAASNPPSPVHDCTHGCAHYDGPKQTRENSPERFRRLDATTPLHSHPRLPKQASEDDLSALPPIPSISPTMSKGRSSKHKRTWSGTPGRNSTGAVAPNSSSRRIAFAGSHRRTPSKKSNSPGPPPPRIPLRTNRATTSIDGSQKGTSTGPHSPTKVSPILPSDDNFKSIGYHELEPVSPGENNHPSSSNSTGSSSEAAISTGRRWVVQSKAKGQEVPVIDVQIKAPSPRPRRVLRRARPGSSKGSIDTTGINKRMSLHQTSQPLSPFSGEEIHFPSHPIIRPFDSPGMPRPSSKTNLTPEPSSSSPAKATPSSSPPKNEISIPVRNTNGPRPRPRNARMPSPSITPKSRRHSRPPTAPTTPPPHYTPTARANDIQTISPMTIDASLPSPPPRRDLPPTPDQKRQMAQAAGQATHSRASSLSESEYTDASRSRKRVPQPLNFGRLVGKFPSPPGSVPESAKSLRGQDGGWGPMKVVGPGHAGHVVRQVSCKVPTSKFSPAVVGRQTEGMMPGLIGQGSEKEGGKVGLGSENSALLAAMQARMDAMERHNRLVEAALMAMLKVNGVAEGPDATGLSGLLGRGRDVSEAMRRTMGENETGDDGEQSKDRAEVEAFRQLTSIGHPAFASDGGVVVGAEVIPTPALPQTVYKERQTDEGVVTARQETSDRLHGLPVVSRQNSQASKGSARSRGSGKSAGSQGSLRSNGSQRSALDTYMKARGMMDTSRICFD